MSSVSPEFFAPDDSRTFVRLRRVFRIYRVADTGVVALSGVDLEIERGAFLAIVGPSGSGKSTMLNLIGGIDRASAGAVEVDGIDLGRLSDDELTSYRATRVGFVWQGTARNLVPYLTVRENVRLPTTIESRMVAGGGHGADELLHLVGLGDRRGHLPGQLSGGEQQRAAIAVALANTPAMLLADEPTAELDSASATTVLDAFTAVNREFGVTIAMVTHDLVAARRAHRVVRVRDGRLLHQGSPVDPIGDDGRLRLPDDAVAQLGGAELEAEVIDGEVRLRRKGEPGRA